MHTYPHPKTIVVTALTALALTFSLSACGDDNSDGGPSAAVQTATNGDVFNDADVQFATDMIPHHAQAVQMVVLTEGRTLDPAVQDLANQIRDAQVPEVETMSRWLTSWGEKVPATSLDHVNAGHDMNGMDSDGSAGTPDDMPGMMSADDMETLARASDADFQDMWLTMMIEHHTGAIEMAKTELTDGEFADATKLATSIESSQQVEIDTMKGLLDS